MKSNSKGPFIYDVSKCQIFVDLHLRTEAGPRPYEGGPLCPKSPMIPFYAMLGVFRAMLGVFRAMAGSIEVPRRVLDPIRGDLCVPRVP